MRRDTRDFTFYAPRAGIAQQHKEPRLVGIQPDFIVQRDWIRPARMATYEYAGALSRIVQVVRTELFAFAPATPGFDMDYRFTDPMRMGAGHSIQNFMAVPPWTFCGYVG